MDTSKLTKEGIMEHEHEYIDIGKFPRLCACTICGEYTVITGYKTEEKTA